MKYPVASLALVLGLAGCASSSNRTQPAQQTESTVSATDTVERGFLKMSTDDYVSALASAMSDVRQAHPDWSQAAVETEAVRRADEAKRKYEGSYSTRTSTEVKWSSTTTSP